MTDPTIKPCPFCGADPRKDEQCANQCRPIGPVWYAVSSFDFTGQGEWLRAQWRDAARKREGGEKEGSDVA